MAVERPDPPDPVVEASCCRDRPPDAPTWCPCMDRAERGPAPERWLCSWLRAVSAAARNVMGGTGGTTSRTCSGPTLHRGSTCGRRGGGGRANTPDGGRPRMWSESDPYKLGGEQKSGAASANPGGSGPSGGTTSRSKRFGPNMINGVEAVPGLLFCCFSL